ncbi:MAG TPA: LptA/OstA family protein [Xanthobacteraceae bacterium]|nr:LptA/OstA family protein [Xanthobacteraceae bacterium]
MNVRAPLLLSSLLAGAVLTAVPAQAQGVPNALQGFATSRSQPVKIDANSLEVRDKDKAAIFSGNVVVSQGDTTMRSRELVVFYDGKEAAKAPDGAPNPPAPNDAAGALAGGSPVGSAAIRRLEANGGVVVTTKEQTATGDQGVFEMRTNTITLTGKPVVLTSGQNVIRGQKLTVDLNTGSAKFEGGRVESLIVPNSVKQPESGGKPSTSKPAPPKPQ